MSMKETLPPIATGEFQSDMPEAVAYLAVQIDSLSAAIRALAEAIRAMAEREE